MTFASSCLLHVDVGWLVKKLNPLLEGDFFLRWMITLTYLVSLLTNFYTMLFCSVVRFRASPAAEKKQKQQLNMTVETKAQQDKVAKCKIAAAEKKRKQ
jgi:hypothetical protein